MKPINANKFRLALQKISKNPTIPSRYYLQRWVVAALAGEKNTAEIVIRIVDNPESSKLNSTYRHKKGPTNVLSFPFEPPAGIKLPLLGDLIICAPVVAKEAKEQKKSNLAHWAHMIIHGTLHLLGYDHIRKKDALIMEKLEIAILAKLGFPNPYKPLG